MHREENRRILIVDDNESIHADFRKIIGPKTECDQEFERAAAAFFDDEPVDSLVHQAAYQIDSAYQGQQGLEMVLESLRQDQPYALAFVDVRMPPGWDGIETVQHFWEVDPHLQIVICSAYSDYSWNDMVKRLGQTDQLLILKKPFDNIEARQLACALCAKWNLAREVRNSMDTLQDMVRERTAELDLANRALRDEVLHRKQSAEALSKAEARTRAILDTAADGIMTLDAEGVIETANRAAERIFGYAGDEMIGKQIAALIPDYPEYHFEFLKGSGDRKRQGEVGPRREMQGTRKDGSRFPLEIALTGMATASPMFTAMVRDATRQKQLEAQLVHAQKLEAVGMLAGGVAHEFNNLLQVMQGYTIYAMESIAPGEQAQEDLGQVLNAVNRAAMLTRQLLSFSRAEELQKAAIDARPLFLDGVQMLRPLMGEHIELSVDISESPAVLFADRGMLQQVLVNLCLNARDAMPGGGRLVIRTDAVAISSTDCDLYPELEPGHYLTLTVSDTGTGMDSAVKARIFEPFFTTKEIGKGTGLGLAMVYGIVQQHFGAIQVDSEPGQGTTFRVLLPLLSESQPTEEIVAAAPAPGGSETILVAEDEPGVRSLAVRMMTNAGYRVLEAVDGEEAFSLFRRHQDDISLTILDILMPRMNGRETYEQIKAIQPGAKIVYCSGFEPDLDAEHGVLDHGVPLIRKPFDPDSLLHLVREIIDQRPAAVT